MKRLFTSIFGHIASFMPSGAFSTAKAEIKPQISTRHMDVINPPAGVPSRIDWDLNDPKSLAQAQALIRKLQESSGRCFFTESAPGQAGQHLKAPDVKENMISVPQITAG